MVRGSDYVCCENSNLSGTFSSQRVPAKPLAPGCLCVHVMQPVPCTLQQVTSIKVGCKLAYSGSFTMTASCSPALSWLDLTKPHFLRAEGSHRHAKATGFAPVFLTLTAAQSPAYQSSYENGNTACIFTIRARLTCFRHSSQVARLP